MDKNRVEGLAEHVKGKINEVAGKVIGDSKLENERYANSVATILLQPPRNPFHLSYCSRLK